MIKTIIFDFDGTLADSAQIFLTDVMNILAKKYGIREITQKDLELMKNEGTRNLLSSLKINPLKIPMLIMDMKSEMAKRISTVKPFDGIKEALFELKTKGLALGILTSNTVENVNTFLEINEFPEFNFVYSENDLFGKDKTLNHLISKHNLLKEEIIYVGDETRDIEACKKAEVKVIGVTWGYNSKKLLESAQPDFIVNSPKELTNSILNQE